MPNAHQNTATDPYGHLYQDRTQRLPAPAPWPAAPPQRPRYCPPRRKRPVFLWVFVIVQLIFAALAAGVVAELSAPAHAQVLAGCYHHAWQPLFRSKADCVTRYGAQLASAAQAARQARAGIAGIVWTLADVVMGAVYGAWKLASR